MTQGVIAWDVGGANTKAAWLPLVPGEGAGGPQGAGASLAGLVTARCSLEVWREPEALPARLRELAACLPPAAAMALTMTAELSDVFRTKVEGVGQVIAAVRAAFPDTPLSVLDVEGQLVAADAICGSDAFRLGSDAFRLGSDAFPRADLLPFAAANWVATASLVAAWLPAAVLMDVGSTTTDIVPVAGGRLLARGRDDTARLAAGELVYTGALRTPVAAVASTLPVRGVPTRTAPEHFALVADAYLLLGDLRPEDYTCPTADGRPATAEFAAERLARAVCAEAAALGADGVRTLATAVAERQVGTIAEGLLQVISAEPRALHWPVVTTGVGAWLARRAAERVGLAVRDLAELAGAEGSAIAPAAALAWLLRRALEAKSGRLRGGTP
jgi:probable H4MPT-linked C1 transfer pathway protein